MDTPRPTLPCTCRPRPIFPHASGRLASLKPHLGGSEMGNRTGTGQHVGTDAAVGGREAARQAREGLGGAQASFGFLFASPDLPLGDALRAARTAAGTQQIIGCTTAGEVTERGLTHGGVAVLLVSAPQAVAET